MKKYIESITQYFSPNLINSTKRVLKFLFFYTIAFIILVLGIKYAIPFIIAYIIAISLRPLKNRILLINKRFKNLKCAEGVVAFLLTTLIVSLIAWILFVLGCELAEQLVNFYNYITNKDTLNTLMASITYHVNEILDKLDNNFNIDIMNKVNEVIQKVIASVTSLTAVFIKSILNVLVSIPTAFLMIIKTIVATFFFTKDIDKIERKIIGAFSEKGLLLLKKLNEKKNEVFSGYIKAYSMIMIGVFIYSIIPFKLAGVEYATVISLITAILDALPLFGAGLVYGIFAISFLILGNFKSFIILIIGYIGAVIIRQFLEQQLVSSFLGLNPLIIIIGLFLVLTPLGFKGMFYFVGAFLAYQALYSPKNTE